MAPVRGHRLNARVDVTELRQMADDPTWNFQHPAARGRLLDVFRRQSDEMFDLAADVSHWHTPTACPGWEVRDMVGHLVDATEGYVMAFDHARRGRHARRDHRAQLGRARGLGSAPRNRRRRGRPLGSIRLPTLVSNR